MISEAVSGDLEAQDSHSNSYAEVCNKCLCQQKQSPAGHSKQPSQQPSDNKTNKGLYDNKDSIHDNRGSSHGNRGNRGQPRGTGRNRYDRKDYFGNQHHNDNVWNDNRHSGEGGGKGYKTSHKLRGSKRDQLSGADYQRSFSDPKSRSGSLLSDGDMSDGGKSSSYSVPYREPRGTGQYRGSKRGNKSPGVPTLPANVGPDLDPRGSPTNGVEKSCDESRESSEERRGGWKEVDHRPHRHHDNKHYHGYGQSRGRGYHGQDRSSDDEHYRRHGYSRGPGFHGDDDRSRHFSDGEARGRGHKGRGVREAEQYWSGSDRSQPLRKV